MFRITLLPTAPLVLAAALLISCASGGSDSVCGNGICEPGESTFSCPQDCPYLCGNGVCEPGESPSTCAQDCYCGNGTCDSGESPTTCPADCASSVCGDGVCSADESAASCPGDCYCGNGTCDIGESPTSCPADCTGSPYCGDGTCDLGENPTNCAADCGTCGNGTCDAGENSTTCPEDCSGCTHATCDFWPQCGCDTGTKCSLNSADQRQCMTAGSSPHGSTCTGDDVCAAGTMCVGPSVEEVRCLQFCNDNADCPGDGGVCLFTLNDASSSPIPGAKVCTKDCNPVSPGSTCPAGWTCEMYYVDENQDEVPDYFLTDCSIEAGTAGTGAYCNATTLCAPGNWCYLTDNECIKNCRVGVSGDCPSLTTCNAYSPDPIVIGSVQYGYCR